MKKKRIWAGILVLAMLFCTGSPTLAVGTDRATLPVSGGSGHTVVVTKDGDVYTWGTNRSNQLGIEDIDSASKPVQVKDITAISVAAGYDFTAALSYTGTVYVWGMGQHSTPTEVNLTGVVKIDAGQTDIVALRTDGTVWQWTYGMQPAQVPGLNRIVDISAGGGHNLALTLNGEVYAWGNNNYGQLGDGTVESKTAPVKLSLLNIVDISAGFSHSLAVSYNGDVYAWGNNEYGQLGDGTTDDSLEPVQAKSLSGITHVAAGNGNSLALNRKGNVYAWGYGEFGQLGDGSNTISSSTPAAVRQLSKVAYIECGVQHCMAVTESGVLYVWGRNRDGQVGNSKEANCNTPQKIYNDIYLEGSYRPDAAQEASSWAVSELNSLHNSDKVFPMLWGNYETQITRAEFAALLVSLYENVKGTTVNESSTSTYKDIKGHPLESEIRKAIYLGLLNGTSNATIEPNRTLTRQESVKIICSFISKAKNVSISEKPKNLSFYMDARDIAEWAGPYVYYAYEHDIMKGDNSSNFCPFDSLTREQALIIVARVITQYSWG